MEGVRSFSGLQGKIIKWWGVAIGVLGLIYVNEVPYRVGLFVYNEAYRALMCGLTLVLVFLRYPASKKAPLDKVPWYDYVLCALSLPGTMYIFVYFGDLVVRGVYATPVEIVLGIITIGVVLEATRRTVGPIMSVIGLFMFLYPTFSSYLPSIFMAQNHEMARVIGLSYLFSEGMFGLIVGVVFTLLVVYLFFAQLLAVTGTGKIIIDAAYSLTATVRGGAAKVAIMASGGFGMISGSVPSNVMSTGVFTIPLMKKTGFASTYAAAIEAVAATGGGLTPPIMGAVAFIMAEILNVGYGRVIIVAALPAAFYYFSLFMQIDCRAGKAGLKGLSRAEIPPVKGLKKQIWFFLAPIATLLILLIVFNYSAVTSGIYATVVLILISQFKKDGRVTIRRMADALNETTKTLAFILPVCATAGLIIANIMLTGLGIRLSQLLVSVAQGHMLILLLMAWVVNFILGTGLPAQTSYLLLAVLVAPSLIQGGIHPMAAHLFIIWSAQIAYITPPEGMGFYTAAAVAGANPMQTGWLACRLGIVAYILPFAFAINTHLMLIGGMRGIAGSIVMTTLGVVFLASGLEGYLPVFNKRLGWVARVLFLLGGGIFVFGYSWFVGGTLK